MYCHGLFESVVCCELGGLKETIDHFWMESKRLHLLFSLPSIVQQVCLIDIKCYRLLTELLLSNPLELSPMQLQGCLTQFIHFFPRWTIQAAETSGLPPLLITEKMNVLNEFVFSLQQQQQQQQQGEGQSEQQQTQQKQSGQQAQQDQQDQYGQTPQPPPPLPQPAQQQLLPPLHELTAPTDSTMPQKLPHTTYLSPSMYTELPSHYHSPLSQYPPSSPLVSSTATSPSSITTPSTSLPQSPSQHLLSLSSDSSLLDLSESYAPISKP